MIDLLRLSDDTRVSETKSSVSAIKFVFPGLLSKSTNIYTRQYSEIN